MYKYVNNSTPNRQSLWHLAIGVDQDLDFSRFTENGVGKAIFIRIVGIN